MMIVVGKESSCPVDTVYLEPLLLVRILKGMSFVSLTRLGITLEGRMKRLLPRLSTRKDRDDHPRALQLAGDETPVK